MATAQKDVNHKSTLIGVSSVDGETLVPLAVDPSTGYLLVEIVDENATVGAVLRSDARMDVNHKPTMIAVTDDANENSQCLVTHNGYLAIEI